MRQIDSRALQHTFKLLSRSDGYIDFGSFGGIAGRIGSAILNRLRGKRAGFMETDQERAERHERERIESNERYETERKESGARHEQERKDAREIREHPEDHPSD
jgi:hypothetical protein